ncbi:unnamed protein product [Hapterophycus canaliculatus]
MYLPSDMDTGDTPAQPLVNVDDLRRSGRLAIWPYVMRELRIPPVEALHRKLRCGEHHEVASPIDVAAGPRHCVEYFPSRLPGDGDDARGDLRSRAGADPGTLSNKLQAGHQEEELSGVPLFVHSDRAVASLQQIKGNGSSPDSTGGQFQRLASDPPRHRSSSGQGRRPPLGPLLEAAPPPLHLGTGDRVECPSGCGDDVQVTNLEHHHASLCALRYVSCSMPGCSTLVQARLLRAHLRRDCQKKREQRSLAKKGKGLSVKIGCHACGERIPRRYLRVHLATTCQSRMVQCHNCKEMVQFGSLADHKKLDCDAAKRSSALIDRVARRPAEEKCPACHQMVATSALREHTLDECPWRIVACRNRDLGCEEELIAAEMGTHLRKHCVVRIKRSERAAKSLFRRRRVQCSGCGYSVILQHIRSHQQEKCPNRRVPCKHWELGCPAMLRQSAMDDHLKVDRLLDPRACLVFDSGRAYIALGEGDRKPPWTAEMWIWRPGLVEGTREKARTALKALWDFQVAHGKLAVTERRLALLEPLLIDVATRAAKERSEEAERTRDKLTDEMIAAATVRDDAKVDLVVSSVVLSNSVASAVRGVEEITAQDRLNGFDRLALGSTPWYTAGLCRAGEGLDRIEGGARSVSPTLVLECRPPPLGLPASQSRISKAMVELEEVKGEDTALPGTTVNDDQTRAKVSSASPSEGPAKGSTESASRVSLERDGVIEDNPGISSVGGADADLDGLLSAIAKDQQALRAAEEDSRRKKETEFWAEWVALNGSSLARRLLALAGKTLPYLKEEVIDITGLPRELLFRNCDDPADTPTEGEISNGEQEGSGKTNGSHAAKKRVRNRKAAKKAKRKQKHEEIFGKSIEARIAEEVGKRGGVETLFGSDQALFQLEMGPRERVGIKVAGRKDQIFNYSCPRERWVHLTFVSDATGVFLLENGKTASRLRNVCVALPMREIGGRETACQCLVQEVRYWKVKRSKEELTEWMHQVLPGTSAKDGLMAYWTFEEGRGDYVNDVTEQRFRARIVGSGLKWAVPENMSATDVGAPPTPSWKEQNVCKVELRRGRLAQRGRLHRQLVSYCAAYGTWLRMAESGQELQESYRLPPLRRNCEAVTP